MLVSLSELANSKIKKTNHVTGLETHFHLNINEIQPNNAFCERLLRVFIPWEKFYFRCLFFV